MNLKKYEPYYFYSFMLLNLMPVLLFKFFPTVDGPAHLYNSNLIVNLLTDSTSPLHDFFVFNTNINPNWSGHFLLSLFLIIFPSLFAEKIVLIIYLVGLPLSIRYLFKILSVENKYMIYLTFPFTYSFLFYYGFYNFNIAIVFFMYGISYWIKYQYNLSFFKIAFLTLLCSLICLSHLFVFAVFLLIIFILNIKNIIELNNSKAFKFKYFLVQVLLQIIPLFFGLIIMINYFFFSPVNNSESIYIPFSNIVQSLLNISPSKGINYGKAAVFTNWILYILIAFILYLIIDKLYNMKNKITHIFKNKVWFWISLITFILIFCIPDSKGASIGFMTSRLTLFFFIFLIIWLASQEVNFWFMLCVFLIINYINVSLLLLNFSSIKKGCKVAEEISFSANYIKPYSRILPIINSDNFLFAHISNYLGADKPLIIYENYEAALNHFPLKWKYDKIESTFISHLKNTNNCYNFRNLKSNEKIIDYVILINSENQTENKSCVDKVDSLILSNYMLLYIGTNEEIKLYRKKDALN